MAIKNHQQLFACAVLIMCMVFAAEGAITCSTVSGHVGKCLLYLKNGGAMPQGCCTGIQTLNSLAATTADRQQVCGCLKNIAGASFGINPDLAAGLPGKCGVSVPYKISSSTDCNKVR